MNEDEDQETTHIIERKSDDNDKNNPEPAKLPPDLSTALQHETSGNTNLKGKIDKLKK